jgi:hypothetical protein
LPYGFSIIKQWSNLSVRSSKRLQQKKGIASSELISEISHLTPLPNRDVVIASGSNEGSIEESIDTDNSHAHHVFGDLALEPDSEVDKAAVTLPRPSHQPRADRNRIEEEHYIPWRARCAATLQTSAYLQLQQDKAIHSGKASTIS